MCRDATWQKPKLSKSVDLRSLMTAGGFGTVAWQLA